MKKFKEILRDENGQGMVEYGLILGLIAIAVVAALALLGPKIADMFTKANSAITSAAPTT